MKPGRKERSLLWLRVGMDIAFIIGLTLGITAADIWYPDVFNLTIASESVLPTRYTPITVDKIEIIAGVIGVESGELERFFNKEFTFFLLLGLALFLFNVSLFLSYYYYKRKTGFPISYLFRSHLTWWKRLILSVELFSLIIGTIEVVLISLYIYPDLLSDGLYARVRAISEQLLNKGIIKAPFTINLSLDFQNLLYFFLISCLVLALVEYLFYLPAKKKGYSFTEHFVYGALLWHQQVNGARNCHFK